MTVLEQPCEGPGIGPPLPPLLSFKDEAQFWVSLAEPVEIEAYCLATFRALPANRQRAFLAFVQREIA